MHPDRPQHKYLEHLKAIVVENLDNEQFGVEGLAEAAGISRSQLHRKLKRMLHQTVNDFIREVRLDEALKLLETEELTAAEISYKVGFSSPSYFNKCFHDHFGYTPGEVKKMLEVGLPLSEMELKNNVVEQGLETPIAKPEAPSQIRIADDSEQTSHTPEIKKKVRKKTVYLILVMALLLIASVVLLFRYFPGLNREPAPPSIAVLAFEDRSPTQDQEYLGDGMAEEIMNILSGVESLKVIARSSAFRFKGQNIDVRDMGKQLDVKHIVEGSIMKVDDRLRITVQLVETSGGAQVWSEVYEREMKDIFEIQNSIASLVVKNMESTLIDQTDLRLRQPSTQNMDAYNFFLKGSHQLELSASAMGDRQKAAEYFRKAISLDPHYAEAYNGLAFSHYYLIQPSNPPSASNENYKIAKLYNKKALELDNALAEAYILKAALSWYYDWDWATADQAFETGIALQPNLPAALRLYPNYLTSMGRFDESIAICQNILKIAPISPLSYIEMTFAQGMAGRWEEASATLQKGRAIDPGNKLMSIAALFQYARFGWTERFRKEWGQFTAEDSMHSGPQNLAYYVYCLGMIGNTGEAIKYMTALNRKAREEIVTNAQFCIANLGLGNYDKAIDYLEEAYREKEFFLVWTKVHWFFDPVRDDPRFQQILEKMDFP